jgi:membrane-bound lytic murein transglycosylase D
MSANDVDGQPARGDRSGPLPAPATNLTERLWWLAPLLLVPLLAGVELRDRDRAPTDPEVPSLPALSSGLPLHVHPRVERWVERYRTTHEHEFDALMARRGAFGGLIQEKLRARGMPEELLYLAMIESSLYPWAVSRVSAVGIWQFMSPTAVQYGLRIDEYVDERRDPIRATDAALDYLDWLYTRFGSWYLAAAAYNAGPGRVERILNRHADGRTGEEDLYWEILEHLPRETREYVPRLVALTILAYEADQRDARPASAEQARAAAAEPYAYDRIFVPGGTELSRIAAGLGVEPSILRDLNPHLVRGITPPDEIYAVRVPVGGSAAVMASLAGGAQLTAQADD